MGLDTFLAEEGLEPAPQAPAVDGKKSDSVVKVTAKAEKPSAEGKQVIKLTMAIDKGWHVYANPIGNEDLESAQTKITIAGIEKSKFRIEYPKGKLVRDKLVGDYNVYDNEAVVTVHVDWPKDAVPTPLEISIKLQACNDKSCLLPATIKVKAP
jgi:DsbC/DsbD-like thiol-disulfide interchange protein